jgi:hypothetical protein
MALIIGSSALSGVPTRCSIRGYCPYSTLFPPCTAGNEKLETMLTDTLVADYPPVAKKEVSVNY